MGNLRDRRLDSLTTEVVDFKGRQIKNAGAAVDDSDYVILSQLNSAIKGVSNVTKPSAVTPTAGTVSNTYILEVLGTLAIGTNLGGKRVITSSGKPSLIRFDLDEAATGHTVNVQIYQGNTLYLSVSIPDGSSLYQLSSTGLSGAGSLTSGNYLRLDVTAVGSTIRGKNLYCTITQ